MKILITGSQGQVGRALLGNVPVGCAAVGLTREQLNIGDEQAVSGCIRLHRPDVIINAAAYTAVDRAEGEPAQAGIANMRGPQLLALAAREASARLIHLSTDFVFDGTACIPYAPAALTNPLSVYGRTKREGEEAVRNSLPERSVVLRTAWVYGPERSNFLRTMLRLMAANRSVRVVADQVGTPTSTRSLAKVLWTLTTHPEVNGLYHWTDAGVASWYDFAVAIAEEAALQGLLPPGVRVEPIATEDYPTPARRPHYSVLDKRTLLAALPVTPRHWRTELRSVLGDMADA
jgi:dTDP-4-dehydrorhamnose reductase